MPNYRPWIEEWHAEIDNGGDLSNGDAARLLRHHEALLKAAETVIDHDDMPTGVVRARLMKAIREARQ